MTYPICSYMIDGVCSKIKENRDVLFCEVRDDYTTYLVNYAGGLFVVTMFGQNNKDEENNYVGMVTRFKSIELDDLF